ncbi:MAG: MFS transporter, partial [bacterium]|nr:MFS transporter [bacterium]
MRRRFLRAFAIRPDEAHRVGWLLLHSVFVGLFVAFFISAANALFLARFEAASLPYAYMAAGLVGSLVMGLFGRLRRRLAWMNLLVSYLVFLVIAVGCLYLAALRSDSRWIPFSLFVLLSPGLTLVYLEFWTLAGRLFDLRQSKRFFALVSSGEVISSIVGFFLVPVLTALLGAALHLLPIAILGLVGSIAVVAVIRRRFGHELHDAGHDEGKPAAQAQGAARWRDRYFALTALMMGCVFVTLYLVDFGFLSQVRGHYAGAEQVAGFLGVFFGSAKILELVMKSLVSGRLLSQFGLRTALLVLPGTLLLCALAAVAAGIFPGPATTGFFLLVAGAKLLWLVLRKSVFEPSSKVLYQPLPVTERMTFQTRIEGNVRQTATFVGGIVLLALSRSGAHALGPWLFLLPVLGTMLVLAAALHRQYRRKLLEALGNLSLGHVVPTPLERIKQALDGARPLLVQHTLSTLENIEPGLSEQLRGDLPDAHQPPGTLGIPPQTDDGTSSTAQVVAWASSRDAGDRRSAAAALARRGGEAAERALLSLLWDEDPAVRRAAVIAAGKTGNPQYWPRLIDLLSQGLYAKFASAALISVGEPILRPLDESCRPDGRQIATLVRILRIYQRIGGEAAQRYLLRRIHHLSRHVRRQVFVSLAALDYQARPEEVPWIKQRIEELVGGITWYVAARRDLGTGPAVAEVVHAIDWEIERDTELLYLALALVCEPQALKLVRENLGGGDEAANAYGLEVADEVMPPELKSLLHPIFEQLRPAQLLDRLDLAFPQSSLDRAGRLAEILRLGGSR